jgi:hypothetical protein
VLNAPIIENKLPACTNERIIIPFNYPLSVNPEEVDEIQMSIKSIVTGKNIISDLKESLIEDKKISFNIANLGIQTNTYYKIQIAFVDNNITGYWSNIGIIKIIDKPNIELNLSISDTKDVYWSNFDYIGTFSGSDKEAKYKFTLFYGTHELETSGW